MVLTVKNPPANAGDIRDSGLTPGLGRSPGGGHSNPFQYSCLKNPMDRRAWWAAVQWVTKNWRRLKPLSTHARGINTPGISLVVQWLLPMQRVQVPSLVGEI